MRVRIEHHSIYDALVCCVKLLCPVCGKSSIVQSPFHIKHHCSVCNALFKREDGFFVGAILANVVATELVILLLYVLSLLANISNYEYVLTILVFVAILFPVAFYHHSWSVWLSFDHLIETLPKDVERSTLKKDRVVKEDDGKV